MCLQWDDLLMSIPTDPALMGLLQPLVLPPLYEQDASPMQPQPQLPCESLPAPTSTAVLPEDGSFLARKQQAHTLTAVLPTDGSCTARQQQAHTLTAVLPEDGSFSARQQQAPTLAGDLQEGAASPGKQTQADILPGSFPEHASFLNQQPRAGILESDKPEEATLCGSQPARQLAPPSQLAAEGSIGNAADGVAAVLHRTHAGTSPADPTCSACGSAPMSHLSGDPTATLAVFTRGPAGAGDVCPHAAGCVKSSLSLLTINSNG